MGQTGKPNAEAGADRATVWSQRPSTQNLRTQWREEEEAEPRPEKKQRYLMGFGKRTPREN
jgi:hypothetical protein